ncbi:MAG: hypothetical protein IPO66_09165 [Rhodanobacteraceae bacterium]|nr:hypothetical protein [Rhodanobacteraceae bacterium]
MSETPHRDTPARNPGAIADFEKSLDEIPEPLVFRAHGRCDLTPGRFQADAFERGMALYQNCQKAPADEA